MIRINIKMVLEIGIPAPKRMMRVSANVSRATTTRMTTMIIPSRRRRMLSASRVDFFLRFAMVPLITFRGKRWPPYDLI